jgi:hypothetical protein
MESVLWFINDYILIISALVCLWFGYNCKKSGTYFNDLFEWCMFFVFSIGMTYSLHCFSYNYLFRGWGI